MQELLSHDPPFSKMASPVWSVEISSLFPEILTIIFTYLDVKDRGRVAQVCVKWRDAAYNRCVWKNVEAKLHLRRAKPSSSLFSSLVKRGIKHVQVLSLRRSLRDVVVGIPNMVSLSLSGCYSITDSGLKQAFSEELPALTSLNLSLCKQVTDLSLGQISRLLKNLDTLELGGCCCITNTGVLIIALGLKQLKSLNLRSCRQVSDQGIAFLAGQGKEPASGNPKLEHLGLQDCQKLTDQALKHVSQGLRLLKTINLSFCGSVTDTGIKFLSKMPTLRELNLRSCDNISDIGLGYLSEGVARLSALDVSFCDKVGDVGLRFLSQGLLSLQSLSLNACNISDEGIQCVVNGLNDLTTLNIGQCSKISDKSLTLISTKLRHLTTIDLYGCTQITTVGLEKIMQLPSLSTLNLGLWHKK